MDTPQPSRPPNVIGMCASHVNCVARLGTLRDMVDSWVAQTVKVPLFISLSTTAELTGAVDSMVAQWRGKPGHGELVVLMSPTPRSQFEHYKDIVDTLKDNDAVYQAFEKSLTKILWDMSDFG